MMVITEVHRRPTSAMVHPPPPVPPRRLFPLLPLALRAFRTAAPLCRHLNPRSNVVAAIMYA
jgi:hypothetical protein